MANHTDGGPAFPSDPYIDHPAHGRIHKAQVGDQPYDGMSLRDWFAGRALSALLSNSTIRGVENLVETIPPSYAAASYNLADAMIAERSK